MINAMDCLRGSLRRSSVRASLLVLAVASCGPTATDSQEDTGTHTTSSSVTTDDSSAGAGTSDPGESTDPGSGWTSGTMSTTVTPTTSDPGVTTTGSCGTVACEPCDALDQHGCSCCGWSDTDTGGCMQQRGDRLNREENCLDENEFAVCVPAAACGGVILAYVDPGGTCWLIYEDCMGEGAAAEGWTPDDSFDLCPELADWEGDLPPPC